MGTEDFSILGLSVWSQLFILATQDSDLDYMASDGVFGLGFGDFADSNPTFIENLKSQILISRAIFSFYFASLNWDGPLESVFTIGGHDSDTYGTGDMYTIKIKNPGHGHWMTIIDSISVGKDKKASKSEAIFSTSEFALRGPSSEVKHILDKIKNVMKNCKNVNGLVMCSCSLDNWYKYPTITFYINDQAFSIRPDNYLYYHQGKCIALFLGHSNSNWILGQPFYREYYTIHDMDSHRMYLWKAKVFDQISLPIKNDDSFDFIQSSVLIPAGLFVSGIVYAYRRRQANAYNYQLI